MRGHAVYWTVIVVLLVIVMAGYLKFDADIKMLEGQPPIFKSYDLGDGTVVQFRTLYRASGDPEVTYYDYGFKLTYKTPKHYVYMQVF